MASKTSQKTNSAKAAQYNNYPVDDDDQSTEAGDSDLSDSLDDSDDERQNPRHRQYDAESDDEPQNFRPGQYDAGSDASTDTSPGSDSDDESKKTSTKLLFASAELQTSVHTMLTHLQEWWALSEMLLQKMATKELPCNRLRSMSDTIDKIVDKSIETLIQTAITDPNSFPIVQIVATAKKIKEYLFFKVGEVCCQAGNEDGCAKAAKIALIALKKFRLSANDFYDSMIAHVITEMSNAPEPPKGMSTPDLDALLEMIRAPLTEGAKGKSAPTSQVNGRTKNPTNHSPMKNPATSHAKKQTKNEAKNGAKNGAKSPENLRKNSQLARAK